MNINKKRIDFYLFFFALHINKKEMIVIKNKKVFSICIAVICLISIFFVFIAYKNFKFGNNESNKSAEEIKKTIMNIDSYVATMEVTVHSNKNTNKYLLKQEYSRDGVAKQTVLKPENIEGIEIEYKDGSLIITNSRLNLSKICSEYPYISDNVLWLSSFSDFYKNNTDKVKVYEKNNDIAIELSPKNNEYFVTRCLYLEKETGRPKQMEIKDKNKNTLIYILYNEISINK